MLGEIALRDVRVYAHHGCLPEERIIGSEYRVALTVSADLSAACLSDDLRDTVDYVHLNRIIVEEMAVPSNLLEHVARRIADRILNEIISVETVLLTVSKINPPIGGDVRDVSVTFNFTR